VLTKLLTGTSSINHTSSHHVDSIKPPSATTLQCCCGSWPWWRGTSTAPKSSKGSHHGVEEDNVGPRKKHVSISSHYLASLMDDPEEQDPFNNEADSMWGEHPPPQDDGMLPHHDAEQADLMEAPLIGTQHSCCLLSYR
jgi:hypothetical protein